MTKRGQSCGVGVNAALGWTVVAVVLLSGWLFVHNDFYQRIMMIACVYIVAAIPFGMLMGQMGYLAMGQAAFLGLGAYVVGNLTTLRFEENYWLALLATVPLTESSPISLVFHYSVFEGITSP